MKKRGAIFGGAFDPITTGHLLQVSELLNLQLVSEPRPFFDHVWLVPSGNGRWDKTASISDTKRLELCQVALNDYLADNQRNRVTVSAIEIDCGHFIPSKELWEKFTYHCSDFDEVYLAVGYDQASQIRRWYVVSMTILNMCVCAYVGDTVNSYSRMFPSWSHHAPPISGKLRKIVPCGHRRLYMYLTLIPNLHLLKC
eukprot:Gregarina_sp_Poly_1__9413@NODE_589_length_7363_cov_272_061129_g455_i0_p3_GENE_NODE_589_length_7363_cov_272_061129_g455_i0NODE_589_length_7363_cov_272_061129_g455_i0_p3_ORF_typecomplete_len198_score13_40CTP_transf_like/PF01467_26/5_9e09_NODE_589_length_7363_cov_272_061129_g455_i014192012